MKILVIGGGGREHALAKRFLESPRVSEVYCAPGNAGMVRDGIQLVDIKENQQELLVEFAKKKQLDFTFVGPELPLFEGIVDVFQEAGLKVYGPNKAAAIIEGSKIFSKYLLKKYAIPTADYWTFSDFEEAASFIKQKNEFPIVIKADGLAAGKGVVIAESYEVACLALKEMLIDEKFGESGTKVVIEEFLAGEEFSLLAFVRGEEVYPMVIAQDHKRAYEGDKGPNTGGMGAYSPVPHIKKQVVEEAVEQIVKPTARAMVCEGRSFSGILYAGLILTSNGPKVIEFNARFGDPETQVILPRLKSDFATVIYELLTDQQPIIEWEHERFHIGVVVAAKGYPQRYEKDFLIPELEWQPDENVYYAGVTSDTLGLVANGGRLFLVEVSGKTLKEAQTRVYNSLTKLDHKFMFYRTDIGDRALSYYKHTGCDKDGKEKYSGN